MTAASSSELSQGGTRCPRANNWFLMEMATFEGNQDK